MPRLPAILPPLALAIALGGCTCSRREPGASGAASAAPPASSALAASGPLEDRCPLAPTELAPGLVVERVPSPIPAPVKAGDGCLTVVRIDPARYRFRMLTALADGGNRTVPAWAELAHLTGAVNAAMFGEDLRSVGLLVRDGAPNNDRDDRKFGGFMAFDPVDAAAPPVAFAGRPCPRFDLDGLRKRYRSVVQSYRLLDCEGNAIQWSDTKIYSAAAVGMDRKGSVVFLHARTPWSMTDLARIIASPAIHPAIHDALFVEGGPEASVYVAAGGHTLRALGSWETGFQENDDNARFWDIPNVIGFAPR